MTMFNAIVLITVWGQSHGFLAKHSQQQSFIRQTGARSGLLKSNFGGKESQFYDDFGSDFIGNSSPENNRKMLESLQSKMKETRETEAANDAKLTRNWRRGNWSVRGFELAKDKSLSNHISNDQDQGMVHISAVVAPVSASLGGITVASDHSLPEYRTVVVGRTDGSVFLVRLGESHLTKFASSPKLVEKIEGEDLSFSVEEEWTEQSQIRPLELSKLNPFKILLNFQSSKSREECHSIVYHDIADDNEGLICTASGDSGDINMWTLPLGGQQLQHTSLSGTHQTRIVSLKTAVLPSSGYGEEQHILISASRDGTVAFWDIKKQGGLLFSCKCVPDKNNAFLTCLDISNPSLHSTYNVFNDSKDPIAPDMLFLGTSDGFVMGYDLHKILSAGECCVPSVSYRAHGLDSGKGEGVTAIKSGGEETIVRPNVSSSTLLTGGEDGSVKQWEILTQKSANGIRIDHWPRLATQRMNKKAHTFTPRHEGQVTALSQQSQYDSSTFLSCSRDGSICVWDVASGNLLYRMDGFSSTVSSLACLGRDLLVTDGMEGSVCVHDFSIDRDAAENGYELDW